VETIEGFAQLKLDGMIRHWGVSDRDIDDILSSCQVPGTDEAQTNQIRYNLTRRGPEYALLPWLARHSIPTMAYSPIEQGRLFPCLLWPWLSAAEFRSSGSC
jgi:diketogulonate reductase-like aldo/keto reductase